jgi:hypothetical protein
MKLLYLFMHHSPQVKRTNWCGAAVLLCVSTCCIAASAGAVDVCNERCRAVSLHLLHVLTAIVIQFHVACVLYCYMTCSHLRTDALMLLLYTCICDQISTRAVSVATSIPVKSVPAATATALLLLRLRITLMTNYHHMNEHSALRCCCCMPRTAPALCSLVLHASLRYHTISKNSVCLLLMLLQQQFNA